MKKTIVWIAWVLLAFAAGCAPSPNFLVPASPVAAQEARLFWILLAFSAVIFVIVEGLLLYNVFYHGKKSYQEDIAPQYYRQLTIEAIYTGIPILIVIVLFVLTLRTANAVAAPPPQPGDLTLHIIGHRWWWEFDYPDLQITTANELHIPVNTNVQIDLSSSDVIHSFYVPQLSGKTDAIPGRVNHMWLRGDTVGQYHGQCAEFCGLNHANMRFTVYVDSQADFDAWVKNQQQPPVDPQSDQQKAGQDIIANGVCSGCHDLGDNGPGNPTGPDLTHLMSRHTFAGGTFELNDDNLRRWLEDTQAMKPGNDMKHTFSPQQIDALMAYLTTLK